MVDAIEIIGQMPLPEHASVVAKDLATEPMPQDRRLGFGLPTKKDDMDRGALLGVALGVQWWDPGMPVRWEFANRGNSRVKILRGRPVAYTIAVNTRDAEHFNSLFDASPSTLDLSASSLKQL